MGTWPGGEGVGGENEPRPIPLPLPVEYVWEEKKAGVIGRPGAAGIRFRALMDVRKMKD